MSPEELRLRFSRAMSAELAQNQELMKRMDTMLFILFPHGVEPSDYGDVVLAVQTLERLWRTIDCDADAIPSPTVTEVIMHDNVVEPAVEASALDTCSDGVVQEIVEERTQPLTPRAIERAQIREERPWRRLGSFDLSEFADRF